MELALKKPHKMLTPIVLYDSRATVETGRISLEPVTAYNHAQIIPATTANAYAGQIPATNNGYMMQIVQGGQNMVDAVACFFPEVDLSLYSKLKVVCAAEGSNAYIKIQGPFVAGSESYNKVLAIAASSFRKYAEYEFNLDLAPISSGEWAIKFVTTYASYSTYNFLLFKVTLEP